MIFPFLDGQVGENPHKCVRHLHLKCAPRGTFTESKEWLALTSRISRQGCFLYEHVHQRHFGRRRFLFETPLNVKRVPASAAQMSQLLHRSRCTQCGEAITWMCAAGLLDDVQTLYRYSPRCLWHLSILPSLLPDIPIRKI